RSRGGDSEVVYRRALKTADELARAFPKLPEYRKDLADIHGKLAVLYQLENKPDAAEPELQQALALLEQLTTECPDVPNYRHELARGQYQRANLLHDLGRSAEAQRQFTLALSTYERLAGEFPLLSNLRQEWAWLLVACPAPECRNAELTRKLARQAVGRASCRDSEEMPEV